MSIINTGLERISDGRYCEILTATMYVDRSVVLVKVGLWTNLQAKKDGEDHGDTKLYDWRGDDCTITMTGDDVSAIYTKLKEKDVDWNNSNVVSNE